MSKMTERLKATVFPDGDAAKIDAAIAAKHAAIQRGKEREEKIAAAVLTHDAANRAYELATATADGPDDPALAKLKRNLDSTTANLDFLRTALKGDQRAIAEADQALSVLGREKHTKTFKRQTVEADKRGKRLAAAIKEYVDAVVDFYEIKSETAVAYPFGTMPGGCLTRGQEIYDLIARGISRVSPVPATDVGTLKIPGAYNNPLVNARNFPSLEAEVAASNAHIMRLIEKGPAPSVVLVEAKAALEPAVAAIAPTDPDAAILETSGPVLSAEQVMTAIGRRRMA